MQVRGANDRVNSTWLFYRPDVRLVSQRPPPGVAERAAAATIHWRDQLAARGIRLIVVVAPTKALVHPPASVAVEAVWKSPELQAYQAALQAGQVEYVDLHAAFAAAPPEVRRKAPMYLPTDTHWSGSGLDLTSAAIVERLGRDLREVVAMPDVRARLEAEGADVIGSTPEQFAAFLKAEIARWAEVVRTARIRAD
jgi:hypothetical protein